MRMSCIRVKVVVGPREGHVVVACHPCEGSPPISIALIKGSGAGGVARHGACGAAMQVVIITHRTRLSEATFRMDIVGPTFRMLVSRRRVCDVCPWFEPWFDVGGDALYNELVIQDYRRSCCTIAITHPDADRAYPTLAIRQPGYHN